MQGRSDAPKDHQPSHRSKSAEDLIKVSLPPGTRTKLRYGSTVADPSVMELAADSLHTDIQGNAELAADVEAACQVAEFDVNDIVFVEMGADGNLIVYYDDAA